MKNLTRFAMVGLVALALGSVILLNSSKGTAGEEEALGKQLDAITAAVQKGDMKTVKKLSEKLAEEQEEVYYVMLLLKPRTKKGIGVGKTPGAVFPDGIERKLQSMARDVMSTAKLKKEKEALIEMAYRLSALGHFSTELPPARDKGKMTKKAWLDYSKDLEKVSLDLVKAIKTDSPSEVKKASSVVNSNCNNCHSIFR